MENENGAPEDGNLLRALARAEVQSEFEIHGDPGPLFGALAKAQAAFDEIHRTRTVQVRSEKANYDFAYAPLDEILRATGKGLTENGLAIVQAVTGPAAKTAIRTILGHESGAYIESLIRLPEVERDVQKLGSAITYLRRYSIQAILGVAAEEDDDGAAPGTQAVTPRQPAARPPASKPPASKAPGKAQAASKSEAPRTGAPMDLKQYEAIGAAFVNTEQDDIPKVCMEVVGKEPPESAGSASGWTSEDAEKLLAHLKGAK